MVAVMYIYITVYLFLDPIPWRPLEGVGMRAPEVIQVPAVLDTTVQSLTDLKILAWKHFDFRVHIGSISPLYLTPRLTFLVT